MSAEQAVLVEGLEERVPAFSPTAPPGERKPRLKPVHRQQVCLRVIDPDRLVEEDHPVRAIWDLLGRLDLSPFYEGIKAVEGQPGRDRSDPRVLIALWLYALSRGVREASAAGPYAFACGTRPRRATKCCKGCLRGKSVRSRYARR